MPMRNGHWTMMAAIDSHILMFAGLILANMWIIYPIALFAISTTLWVVGIFHLRRVLRIWGFGDLILGIAASLLMLGAASSINAIGLFLLLTVVGAELCSSDLAGAKTSRSIVTGLTIGDWKLISNRGLGELDSTNLDD